MSERPASARPGTVIDLRPETVEDLPFLAELYASTRWEELRPVPWSDEQKRAFLAMQFQAQHAHYRSTYAGARWDVIIANQDRAGRLYVCPMQGQLRIVDISMLPKYRGMGIGTHLLSGLIEEAERAGARLSVHVEQMNPALHWYERLGFKTVGERVPYLYMERPPSALATT